MNYRDYFNRLVLGGHVQGTATYWHCNNATLVASGMDYYAYGRGVCATWFQTDHFYQSVTDRHYLKRR